MTFRGWRFVTIKIPREEVGRAFAVLSRYPFVESKREVENGVACVFDLGMLPPGDGPAAELMVKRDVERASALHRTDA